MLDIKEYLKEKLAKKEITLHQAITVYNAITKGIKIKAVKSTNRATTKDFELFQSIIITNKK